MASEEVRVEPILAVKLASINDLARLASSASTMGHVTYVVHFAETPERHIYGIFIVFRDYYKLYGLPMFYYIESKEELRGNYILFRSDDSGEQVEVSKGAKPGYIAIPIVNLAGRIPIVALGEVRQKQS
ncbi:hypothetical protein [Thermofilum pendens]|uniref:Cren protein n=1 Tax=Thermofilum pendens (strain DSM 2475 / Hrk 5) TaxID=368408 RepID=A1RXL0_THEPD|nr:hypothetical protein [Thermofilum pendens]ABL77940.1 hypothetical protein Tpen_0534 [Thermofilum pendens Hrk 5]